MTPAAGNVLITAGNTGITQYGRRIVGANCDLIRGYLS